MWVANIRSNLSYVNYLLTDSNSPVMLRTKVQVIKRWQMHIHNSETEEHNYLLSCSS